MPEADRPLETIVQVAGSLVIGRRDADQTAKLNDEGLIMRSFPIGHGPMRDKGVDIHRLLPGYGGNL